MMLNAMDKMRIKEMEKPQKVEFFIFVWYTRVHEKE